MYISKYRKRPYFPQRALFIRLDVIGPHHLNQRARARAKLRQN